MFSIGNLLTFARGRVPGQVVVQYTDRCNARCPQCDMRVQNKFERQSLDRETAIRVIDTAAEKGIAAISFTGGEPFMHQDDILALIRHAGEAGIEFIRTGTNGFMFLGSDKPSFEPRVHKLAEALAATKIYTFWISIDSVEPEVHEQMRGLPGVVRGIEKALPIFRQYGIYPSANLGINRNIGGDYRKVLPDIDRSQFDPDQFYDSFRGSFARFYSRIRDLGFTIVNMCYPMSVDRTPTPTADLNAIYFATSSDRIIRFRRNEKLPMFRALLDTVPEFRSQLRIFTPMTAVLALVRQYSDQGAMNEGCRGGVDFFYVDSADASAYPCGYRGQENFGKFWDLDIKSRRSSSPCTQCDWECFRDPSEMLGPLLNFIPRPWATAKRLWNDRQFARLWLGDIRYYRACSYFSCRVPPDYKRLAKFAHREDGTTAPLAADHACDVPPSPSASRGSTPIRRRRRAVVRTWRGALSRFSTRPNHGGSHAEQG